MKKSNSAAATWGPSQECVAADKGLLAKHALKSTMTITNTITITTTITITITVIATG